MPDCVPQQRHSIVLKCPALKSLKGKRRLSFTATVAMSNVICGPCQCFLYEFMRNTKQVLKLTALSFGVEVVSGGSNLMCEKMQDDLQNAQQKKKRMFIVQLKRILCKL